MDFLKNKTILVTGASGMVGTHVLCKLKDIPGVKIIAVDFAVQPKVSAANIFFVRIDLTDITQCKKIFCGVDYVLMLAGRISRRSPNFEYLVPNAVMNMNTLEVCRQAGVKKAVWLATATAYSLSKGSLKEEDMNTGEPWDTYAPLGWTSRYIEKLCWLYSEKLFPKMSIAVLRVSAIYGEYGDFNPLTCHVLPALIRKVAQRQEPLEIWGTGETKRDFIYAGDVADACFTALEKNQGFNEFNIGLGRALSVKELLNLILKIDKWLDAQVVYNTSKSPPMPDIIIDCSKAKNLLGFTARVSIEEGIERTMNWFRRHIDSSETPSEKRL